MWQIVKAEVTYNKYLLASVYAIAVGLFLAALIWDCGGVYSIVPNTIVPYFIGFGFLCHKSCKESRERQHSMLPQSRTQQGITRMLFFVLFQGGMFLLWLIVYFVNFSRTPEAIWMMLTANALVLTFRAVGFIFDDTKSSVASIGCAEGWTPVSMAGRVVRVLTYVIVIVLLVLAVAGAGDEFALMEVNTDWAPVTALRDFLRAPLGALVTNVLFFVTFYLSTVVSLPRRAFASSR